MKTILVYVPFTLNMLPMGSMFNFGYTGRIYVELFRKEFSLFSLGNPFSYFFNFILIKFCVVMRLASAYSASVFSVFNVLVNCASVKMIRFYARSVVAVVAHKQTFRDWAVIEFVRKSVCVESFPTPCKNSVSISFSASPIPAGVSFVYSFFKKIFRSFRIFGSKMLRVNTIVISASVNENPSGGNLSIFGYVRKSLSSYLPTFKFSNPEVRTPIFVSMSCPNPAISNFFDVSFKLLRSKFNIHGFNYI